jgi:hypothetical protein
VSYDAATGQVAGVESGPAGEPVLLAECAYDNFGRLTRGWSIIDDEASWRRLFHDWQTGETDFEQQEGAGGAATAYAHGPGLTRLRDGLGAGSAFYVRGPNGQVRWTVTGEGALAGWCTYNAWGGLSGGERVAPWTVWPPQVLPAYLDGDLRLTGVGRQKTDGLPTWKQGAGTATDTTPLVGVMASPEASGGAGQGAAGNPLTPGAANSTHLTGDGPWHTDGPEPGETYGHWQMRQWWAGENEVLHGPGYAGSKAPIGVAGAALDTSSIADNRLANLWTVPDLSGSSEYYGVKPGNQTGSANWDDTRNQRLPLPGITTPGVGGGGAMGPIAGPLLWNDPTYYLPVLPFPPRQAGGGPLVPNQGSGGGKGGGTTKGLDLKGELKKQAGKAWDGLKKKYPGLQIAEDVYNHVTHHHPDPTTPGKISPPPPSPKSPPVAPPKNKPTPTPTTKPGKGKPHPPKSSLETARDAQDPIADWVPEWMKNLTIDSNNTAGGTYLDGPLGNFGLGDKATQVLDSITGGGYSSSVEIALLANPDAMAAASSIASVTTQLGMDASGEALVGALGGLANRFKHVGDIVPYNNLKRIFGLDRHHALPRRFRGQFGKTADGVDLVEKYGMHMDWQTHKQFHKELRQIIGHDGDIGTGGITTSNASREEIIGALRSAYEKVVGDAKLDNFLRREGLIN